MTNEKWLENSTKIPLNQMLGTHRKVPFFLRQLTGLLVLRMVQVDGNERIAKALFRVAV